MMSKKLFILFISLSLIFTFALGYLGFKHKNNSLLEVMNNMTVMNWGLSFQEKEKPPVIDVNKEFLEQYDAYYLGDEENKKIYLTFDAGYENGNTEKILDILKDQQVKATFFLVGNYMEKCPEIVKRMVEEGHIVGNHTYHHKDMATFVEKEAFMKELTDLENYYKDITGSDMPKFYRPPQGKYTEQQLTWAKEEGYKTCFWSLAYVDWDEKKQPTREEAMEKLTQRIHPGSIILLHSTSSTNAEILDDIIMEWKNMGYTFGELDELNK